MGKDLTLIYSSLLFKCIKKGEMRKWISLSKFLDSKRFDIHSNLVFFNVQKMHEIVEKEEIYSGIKFDPTISPLIFPRIRLQPWLIFSRDV